MGDIFDEIVTKKKKTDIFDEITGEEQGDIFDQLSTGQERPAPSFSALPPDYKEHKIVEPPPTPGPSAWESAHHAVYPVPANIAAQTMLSAAGAARLLGFDEWGEEKGQEARMVLEQVNKEHPVGTDTWWEALRGALTSIGVQIPALATGNVPLALTMMGTQTGLAGAEQALTEGTGKPAALAAGTVKGASEALTELIPTKYLLRFSGPLKSRLIGLIASEAPGETINTVVDWVVDNAVSRHLGKEEASVEDLTRDISRTLKTVAMQTPLMAGGAHMIQTSAIREAVQKAAQDMRDGAAKTAADHMEKHGLRETIVFSAEKSGLEKDLNEQNTEELEQALSQKGIPYRKVQGMYEGQTEASFVVPNLPGARDVVRSLAEKYGQESMLSVDGNGKPALVFKDGTVEELPGTIQEVSKEEAERSVGYTHDPESGLYFTNVEQGAVAVKPPRAETPQFQEVLSEIEGTKKGMTPEPAGAVGLDISSQKTPIRGIESINPEVEARMLAAEGLPKTKLTQRIAETGRRLKAETQHFRWLDSHEDAAVIDVLRLEEAIPGYTKALTKDVEQWITAGLDKIRLRIMARNLVLADIMKDIESGLLSEEDLPFAYQNNAEVAQDYAKFRMLAEKNPEIQQAIDRRQRFMSSLRQELVQRNLLPEEELNDDRYFHHQVLLHMADKTTGTYSRDVRIHRKGWQMRRSGKGYEYNTEYVTAEYEVISQALALIERQKTLEELEKYADISESIVQEGKARERKWKSLRDLQDLFPDEYEVWQVRPGTHFFPALTVTERVLGEVLEGTRSLTQEDIGQVLAAGKRKGEWVIPERLAKTLDEFRDYRPQGVLSQSLGALNTTWKQWTLLNPYRVVKYNLNNMSGDLDIALAYNPKILKHFKPALREAWLYKKGKTAQGDVREALRFGVIDSGITVHEIADITKQGFYRALMGERPSLVTKYWDSVKGFTTFRENILRLAAYKHFKAEIAAGKQVYGASNPWEVDAITDPQKKAAKLARELIGDYGNISHAGQWIRRNLIPFYSWMEINAPRYVRLMRNVKYEGAGSRGRVGAVAGWAATKKAGSLAFKISLLFNAANLWNMLAGQLLGIGSDERERITKNRNQLHIILGRGKDGKIKTLRFQGAVQDALNWFALDTPWEDIKALFGGKLDPMEKLIEMVKAPAEKLIHGAAPIPKTLGEVLFRQTMYPDPFNPRPVRDRGEHFARMWSMDAPYRYLAGKPTRGLGSELFNVLGYSSDPQEQAYYDNYNRVWDFLEEHGRERLSRTPSKKANALYYLRQAMKYGDKKATEKYFKKYVELGGTPKGIKQSIKRLHPLAQIPKKLRGKYIASLSPQETKTLESALRWYEETYLLLKRFE